MEGRGEKGGKVWKLIIDLIFDTMIRGPKFTHNN